ncbi:NAD(P)H-dependent oxidoreductase subunit E [Oryzobacter sp. R7]|uniref:NAD(P)H-dependent oxidoreductase subunit E n=1 Tax=Oryzobacter faecalis TaxID=3388656 RepID=UPI00398CFA59
MPKRSPSPVPTFTPADPARAASVRAIAEQLATLRGPLLPILHEVVETHGYVHDDDIPVIADVLNLSRADVHGTVTFYHDFRRTPPAAHRVSLCRGEACQSRGAESLYAAATDRWARDEDVEVGEVFCLGLCAQGPSGTLDGTLLAALTADKLATLTEGWER